MRLIAILTVRPVLLSLAAGAVLSFTPGCKSSKEKIELRAASTQTPGEVRIVDGGLIMISDAGTIAMGVNTKIPGDFPKAIPIYPGARVNMASRSTCAQARAAWSLSLETGDDQATVVAYYAKTMGTGAAAFTRGSDLALGDTQMTVWQSAQYDVTLMISAGADSQTAITMTVAGK